MKTLRKAGQDLTEGKRLQPRWPWTADPLRLLQKAPKKAVKRLTKGLAASVNKIPMSMEALRKAGGDLTGGKRLQPNGLGLQIH
jgi:hypothetical protein